MRTIGNGEMIPSGFSMRKDNRDCKNRIYLKFPFFLWKRRGYEPCLDEFFTGIWTLNTLIAIDTYYTPGFGVRLLFGWERSPTKKYQRTNGRDYA